jgi:hypothetical protein
MKRNTAGSFSALLVTGIVLGGVAGIALRSPSSTVRAQSAPAVRSIDVDYPAEGSTFPPDFAPPTFLWHDDAAAQRWMIDIDFSDGAPPLRVSSAGEAPSIGPIDPRCVAPSNRLPQLPPRLASDHAWVPSVAVWAEIKRRSQEHLASLTFTGVAAGVGEQVVSRGRVAIRTSRDPVGAPIFYRDVPLIPSKGETGVIKPLAQASLPLLAWRLRDVSQPTSRLLLTGMHTCANCHSFSADGKVMGMDLDGPGNDKGLYFLAAVQPQMRVTNREVMSWSAIRDKQSSISRIGFMSQVSPDGRYVVTMLRGLKSQLATSYFVVNFLDYQFLQVFFPTRGTLAWYDRAAGQVHPLPGADDPRYVQTNPVWSPDGQSIVFVRAAARDPMPAGGRLPEHSMDPEEMQIKFDLYRIPFNNGHGGVAQPVEGASGNGMSNSFPKVSPDGRWIVYVESRNAMLMRPDGKLYIVPAAGGVARPLECNTPLMNSWHSFSPNGHWLVFSSKSRSPYTQMFLTHLDAGGHASPPLLVENATAANRAVNLPEFVNIPADGLMKIDVPAAESFRLQDLAEDLTARGELEPAIATWKQVLALDPDNAHAHLSLGVALQFKGELAEATRHLSRAQEIDPDIDVAAADSSVIAYFNREQFHTAQRRANCANVVAYGEMLLAVAPKDDDVATAVSACKTRQSAAR